MMTLILYMTSHGCAGKAAGMIRDLLPGEVILINLESSEVPPLDKFDTIIIGGSIRIGTLQKRIKKYCEKNLERLLEKKIGLFICCMFEEEVAMDQLKQNYPEMLWQHASALGLFGGELEFEKLNAFERMIIKQVVNISVDVSKFNEQAVKEFVGKMLDAG